MKSFKKWLEDTGQAWPATNDEPYALAGVQSRMVANDAVKAKPEGLAAKIYGKKKKKKKGKHENI